LKSWGSEFVGGKEIARRSGGKKKFNEDPDWAKPVLLRMVERNILESSAMGHYRIKPLPKKKHDTRWVSPDIAKILEESGVKVEVPEPGNGLAPDEFYDQL
jgi:hypothetical protein